MERNFIQRYIIPRLSLVPNLDYLNDEIKIFELIRLNENLDLTLLKTSRWGKCILHLRWM